MFMSVSAVGGRVLGGVRGRHMRARRRFGVSEAGADAAVIWLSLP